MQESNNEAMANELGFSVESARCVDNIFNVLFLDIVLLNVEEKTAKSR